MQSEAPLTLIPPLRAGRGELERTRLGSPMCDSIRSRRIERQSKILEDCLGALVDQALKHAGTLAHSVHWIKVLADKPEEFQRIELDRTIGLPVHLDRR